MKRFTRSFAPALMALALMAVFATASSSVASAQQDSCCIGVDNNTHCPVTFCVEHNGNIDCITIAPGGQRRINVLCDNPPNFRFALRTPCGPVPIGVDECKPVQLEGGCCARACLRRVDGCVVLTVTALPEPCPCP